MSTWTYNPNVPNPPNDPADDVFDMQTNSGSIASLVAVDHVPFNVAGGGEHAQVTFNANNVPGSFPVSPPKLFTNTAAGLPQLFFYSGDAAHSSNQYTISGNGSTFLLGGIIIKWGAVSFSGTNTSLNIVYSALSIANYPNNAFFAGAFPVTSTGVTANVLAIENVGLTGFTITRAGGSGVVSGMTVRFMSIGN